MDLAHQFQSLIFNNIGLLIQGARLLVPLLAIFTASYLLIIRPQREQRQHKRLIAEDLKIGVTVTTANNLHGTVICIAQNTVIIELDTGQKVEVFKQAITTIHHAHCS